MSISVTIDDRTDPADGECRYCGNFDMTDDRFCHGCGAPKSGEQLALSERLRRNMSIYVYDAHPKSPRGFGKLFDTLEKRGAAILVILAMLWLAPTVLFVLVPFGLFFFMWIYLPYLFVSKVLGKIFDR